jgi:hypothetical protein
MVIIYKKIHKVLDEVTRLNLIDCELLVFFHQLSGLLEDLDTGILGILHFLNQHFHLVNQITIPLDLW